MWTDASIFSDLMPKADVDGKIFDQTQIGRLLAFFVLNIRWSITEHKNSISEF